MDIKSALNAVLPPQVRAKDKVERTIKSDSTTDRDANGQQAYSQNQEQHHEPMSDEQFDKALDTLLAYPAVIEHNLFHEVSKNEKDGKRIVILKEPDGKVIRRITEAELWTLPIFRDQDPQKKGQLLRKTA
jgi:hypothetical protein